VRRTAISRAVLRWASALLFCCCAAAQQQDVFLIKALGCRQGDNFLTGFRVQGREGVYTSLHGVVGCRDLSAELDEQKPIERLLLSQSDVRNDVAVLTSPDIGPAVELRASTATTWPPRTPIVVWGHPRGIDLIDTDGRLKAVPTSPLKSLIDPSSRAAYARRRSPDPQTTVLRLEAPLIPGHSGSPVMDAETGQVIAVVDGGLAEGSEIAWAMPLTRLQLRPASSDPELDRIKSLGSAGLLALNRSVPPVFPIRASSQDNAQLGEGHHMTTEVTVSASGSLDAVTTITNDAWFAGFCGRVAFWLADGSGNIVYHAGLTGNEKWCVEGRVTASASTRQTFHQRMPKQILSQVRAVSILQTTAERDPYAYIQENLRRAQQVMINLPVK
jgi:hypothetical protein